MGAGGGGLLRVDKFASTLLIFYGSVHCTVLCIVGVLFT